MCFEQVGMVKVAASVLQRNCCRNYLFVGVVCFAIVESKNIASLSGLLFARAGLIITNEALAGSISSKQAVDSSKALAVK